MKSESYVRNIIENDIFYQSVSKVISTVNMQFKEAFQILVSPLIARITRLFLYY